MNAEIDPLPILDTFAHLCSLTPLHTYAVYQIKSSLVLIHKPARDAGVGSAVLVMVAVLIYGLVLLHSLCVTDDGRRT